MQKTPRIALLVETSVIYGRQILRGISRYLREHRRWSIFLEQRELGARPPAWLMRQEWDGIISRSTDPRLAGLFRKMNIPVVDLNDLYDSLGFPRITSDNHAIGQCGADYYLEKGFCHFGFCGFSHEPWAAGRRDGFVTAVTKAGAACSVFESPWRGNDVLTWDQDQKKVISWIQSLKTPTAVMTCNDVRGQHVLNACNNLGLNVPEQLAVLGVDNEEVLCEMCSPPLSSIAPNPEKIGYEAATLLDTLIMGKKTTGKPLALQVEPIGVVTRQSTDILAIDDPAVSTALRYIREQAVHGCTVDKVLRHVPLSRSILERRFRRFLNKSPQQEIRTVQIDKAKQLLIKTDLTLTAIAELSGFKSYEYMSALFKDHTGHSPGQYRKMMRTR